MLKVEHSSDYLKDEGRGSQAVELLKKKQQSKRSLQPKSRLRRQYNPDDTNIAKLFLAIREHKTGNPQLNKVSEVERLLTQVENINDIDLNDNGNTPLHVAVSKGHEDIVKLLLEKGVKVDIKNDIDSSPLDIAMGLNEGDIKKNIVKALGEKIVENSLKELKEKESQILMPSYAQNKKVEEEKIEEKIKRKIKFSLEALEGLTKDNEDIKKFTHKNVNIFVLFLEAFALQDVEINNKLPLDKKNKLVKQCFGEEDNKIIKGLREIYTHRKEEIFSPLHLQNFVVKAIDSNQVVNVGSFFTNLKGYVQGVYHKLSGQQGGLNKKDIKKILQLTSDQKTKSKKKVLDLFRDLAKVAYDKSSQDSKKQEKAMFDLTVNIIPLIGEDLNKEEFKQLGDLRNELIHNFHNFGDSTSRMNEFKKVIFNLRSKLFKYYASKEMYDKLCNARLDQEPDKIIDDFSKKLKDCEKEFHQKLLISSEGEIKDSFEHVFSESLFPKRDDNIEDLVGKYLRFMAIIDRERINEEESKISEHYRELSDVERREIFEGFMRLEKIKERYKQQYKEKKEELKKKFGEYGIEESSFDKVIGLYVEGNNAFDKKVVDKVTSIVKGLKSLKNSKELQEYQLSNQDIVSLYDRFIKEKDVFHLSNHKDLLKNYNLSESAKQFIEGNLSNLIKEGKTTNTLSMGVQINITKVVNNILRTFYNAYHKYQIKFDNVKGAFSDKIFLDFLVSQDVELDRGQSFKFRDKNHVFKIIKKLLKVEYTAPYIASLIVKVKSDEVIEEDDLKVLIKILLKENTRTTYLNELLRVKSQKPNFNLYEAVYKILEEGEINAESIRVILGDPEHAIEILDILGKRIDSVNDPTSGPSSDATIKSTKTVLKLLNDVVLELIYKGKGDSALKILGKGESLYQKLVIKRLIEKSDDLIVDNQLNIAKAKNAQGEQKKKSGDSEEANKLYKEALGVLEKIPVADFPRSLLALSRKAYIQNLLKRYSESYKENDNLYKRVTELVLGKDIATTLDTKEIYTEIKKSKKYQDLLDSSSECKKYLNILSIRKSIAYSKLMQGHSKDNKEALKDFKEALKIYNEVLNFQKEDYEEEYRSILPTIKKISFIHWNIGKVNSKLKEYQVGLEHYYRGLEEENKVLEKQRKIYGDYHQDIVKSKDFIIKVLLSIASTYEKRAQYQEAEKIYRGVEKGNLKRKESESDLQEPKRLKVKNCLLNRRKRNAENECLFTWEDVDEFNEEKDEKRDLSKIKIDSEKFVSYIKDLPEEKQSQLIQLADETGNSQGLVSKLISNQKVMSHLNRVGRISGMTMHGMMAKNVLADFLNGNYQGVAINVGFIAGGQGFAKVAEVSSLKGLKLASEGKLFLGRSLRAASPFLARGTSAFVVYDLVNQVKAFKNGTEEALAGVVDTVLQVNKKITKIVQAVS